MRSATNEPPLRRPRIPRWFHFVFGLQPQTEPFHLLHFLCLESCFRVNRPERVRFYYVHEPYGPWWDRVRDRLELVRVERVPLVADFGYRDPAIPRYRYAHESDFVRLERLLETGGVYADMDTLFLEPLPDALFEASFVIGRERDIRHPQDGRRARSLCNAFLMAEPNALFGRRWLEAMPAWFDGTWSNHSTLLPEHLASTHPEHVRVEPEEAFYPFPATAEGFARLFEQRVAIPRGARSIHLWAHLWWSATRTDFSAFHAGLATEEWVGRGKSTYARAARRFLVDSAAAEGEVLVRAAAPRANRPRAEPSRAPSLAPDPVGPRRTALVRRALRRLCVREPFDEAILWSVVGDDEYGVTGRRFCEEDVVVDVGAHVGAFAFLCHELGSRRILAFEPEARNFARLRRNLRGLRGIDARRAAIFRSDGPPRPGRLRHSGRGGTNTGCGTVLFGGDTFWVETQEVWRQGRGQHVAAIPLDDVLSRFERVALLKLDCEGSEFPILLTSRELRRVRQIVGEYHHVEPSAMSRLAPEARIGAFTSYHPLLLAAKLEADGFRVTFSPRSRVGSFRAVRRD